MLTNPDVLKHAVNSFLNQDPENLIVHHDVMMTGYQNWGYSHQNVNANPIQCRVEGWLKTFSLCKPHLFQPKTNSNISLWVPPSPVVTTTGPDARVQLVAHALCSAARGEVAVTGLGLLELLTVSGSRAALCESASFSLLTAGKRVLLAE